MKTNTIQTITLLAIVLLFFTGCDAPVISGSVKDEFPSDILPEETHTGAERLGCLINGEVYTNVKKIRVTATYDYSVPGQEQYKIRTEFWDKSEMTLTIKNPFMENDTLINGRTYFLGVREEDGSRYSFMDLESKIYLTKLDVENKIISGRFEATPYVLDDKFQLSQDSILYITEGRFDITYQ